MGLISPNLIQNQMELDGVDISHLSCSAQTLTLLRDG